MNKEEKEMNSLLGKDSEKELDVKLNRQLNHFLLKMILLLSMVSR